MELSQEDVIVREMAGSIPFQKGKIRKPEYGRFLEDFQEGEVFYHPRSLTITRSFSQEFATTFHDSCPLFLSAPYAIAHGFSDLLVPPLQIFNIVLSLGVQNNSERAFANLGYYNVCFLKPVYPRDTLSACTRVLSRRERGEGKPGIVHVETIGLNQNQEIVIQYERKIMIPPRGSAEGACGGDKKAPHLQFPQSSSSKRVQLPSLRSAHKYQSTTGINTFFEDFQVGDTIVHKNMRTITDEHVPWTYRMGNTHPLHYDRVYVEGLSSKMGKDLVVYGGLVFAWLAGLASRDTTENMLWDLGYTEGYHTQPAISGDTIGSISRVLAVEEVDSLYTGSTEDSNLSFLKEIVGVVHFQLIGVKNISPARVLEKHSSDLFLKENDKKKLGKEKIPEKIFEIERKVLLKKKK